MRHLWKSIILNSKEREKNQNNVNTHVSVIHLTTKTQGVTSINIFTHYLHEEDYFFMLNKLDKRVNNLNVNSNNLKLTGSIVRKESHKLRHRN